MALPSPLSRSKRSESTAVLAALAIAAAGGVIGYLPLLSLLLPMKIEGIAGDARLDLFTATVIAGACASSASNILFGWLSDRALARGRGRRPWVLGGLLGLAVSYAVVGLASTPTAVVIAIVLFQTAVNALLAPIFAIMADEVPDAQKGVLGGLLSLGGPLASGLGAVLVGSTVLNEPERLALVIAAVTACVMPLLWISAPSVAGPLPDTAPVLRRDLAIAWGARMLVQLAGNVQSLYLLYYFESVAPGTPGLPARVGHVLTIAFLIPVPIAVLVGRVSDRINRRKPFLLASAFVGASGLFGMALARDWTSAVLSLVVYTIGSSVFLALHQGFAMQLLPSPEHRGRDLGLLNLTNTLPALLGPLLTWLLATPHDFGPAIMALAVLTMGGGILVQAVQGRQ